LWKFESILGLICNEAIVLCDRNTNKRNEYIIKIIGFDIAYN